ncbi:MAG: RNA polymerase sigma factor RpoD/SigA, partial [Gemmatimonadetes bacterium]|nr:RNA polymerase sigma factor RpoD/SigA [Gemmatimonadota bacterium]
MAYTLQEVLKDEESALRLYFDDIADSTPLSREKEVELSAKIHAGDQEARDELVQANLRFVIDVAKKYQNRGLSLSDLISAGNVGLMTAATRFDGEKGFKFISYAVWWIKQSILQTIAEHARTVRLPLNKLSLLKDISKASRKLGQGRETDPHVDEIAKELDMAPEDVLDTMMHARTVRSLDESFEEDDERSLMNILRDDNQATPDLHVM